MSGSEILIGAAIGAVVGGVGGGVIAEMSDRPWYQGALLGAGTGAFGGAVTGGISGALSGTAAGSGTGAAAGGATVADTATIGSQTLTTQWLNDLATLAGGGGVWQGTATAAAPLATAAPASTAGAAVGYTPSLVSRAGDALLWAGEKALPIAPAAIAAFTSSKSSDRPDIAPTQVPTEGLFSAPYTRVTNLTNAERLERDARRRGETEQYAAARAAEEMENLEALAARDVAMRPFDPASRFYMPRSASERRRGARRELGPFRHLSA